MIEFATGFSCCAALVGYVHLVKRMAEKFPYPRMVSPMLLPGSFLDVGRNGNDGKILDRKPNIKISRGILGGCVWVCDVSDWHNGIHAKGFGATPRAAYDDFIRQFEAFERAKTK